MAKKSTTTIGVISQLRAALSNPVALFVGALLGGFVPLASYTVAHTEVQTFWSLPTLLVAGGLVYSAKTVFQWGAQAFACNYKAVGFVLLIEGVMVLSDTQWLATTALAYLVAINAAATGCSLALRDKGNPMVKAKKAAKPQETANTNAAPKSRKVKLAA